MKNLPLKHFAFFVFQGPNTGKGLRSNKLQIFHLYNILHMVAHKVILSLRRRRTIVQTVQSITKFQVVSLSDGKTGNRACCQFFRFMLFLVGLYKK